MDASWAHGKFKLGEKKQLFFYHKGGQALEDERAVLESPSVQVFKIQLEMPLVLLRGWTR